MHAYELRAIIISEKARRISRPGHSFSIAMKTNTSGVTSILAAEVLGVSSNELSPPAKNDIEDSNRSNRSLSLFLRGGV